MLENREIAWSSNELVKQYNYLSSGHFFDKDTMRFFNSIVTGNYRRLNNHAALFITTERAPHSEKRMATVRLAKLVEYVRESDKRKCAKIVIDTVTPFNTLSLAQAKKAMAEYKPE